MGTWKEGCSDRRYRILGMNVTVIIVCCCLGVCTGIDSDESEVESEEGSAA